MSRRNRPTSSSDPGGWVLSREAARRVDALAVERYGMPSVVLMENAALGLAAAAGAAVAAEELDRVVILAGPGNNGGDGFALARHLHNAGHEPEILMAADPGKSSGDAGVNLKIVRRMGISIARLDAADGAERLERAGEGRVLIVDALLGTGVRDALRGTVRDVVLQVNRLRGPGVVVLAVDVPSGLDCDTGEPAGGGAAIEADRTVTFVALKEGFLQLGSQRWTGDVTVAGIGAPRELVEELGRFVPDVRPGTGSGGSGSASGGAIPAPRGRGRGADGPGPRDGAGGGPRGG